MMIVLPKVAVTSCGLLKTLYIVVMITRSQTRAITVASKYYGDNIEERYFPGGIKIYTQENRIACCLSSSSIYNYIYNQENEGQKIYLAPNSFNPLQDCTDGLAVACDVKKLQTIFTLERGECLYIDKVYEIKRAKV
jgi:hypothetical protein